MKYYEINEEMARRAKESYSFSDYVQGSKTSGYQHAVDFCYELGEETKQRVSEDKHEYINYLCDKYAKKLAEYYNKDFQISLMCPSVMIAGGSNFPVRKKEKQNNARYRNMMFYNEIQEILEKIKCFGYESEVIKSGDPLVLEKLQDKIEELQKKQDEMKECNAYYRKHKTLVGYGDLTDEQAIKLDEEIKNSYYQQPYASFTLTNNNNKLKNATVRLEKVKKVKSQDNEVIETELFKCVRNTKLMRVQFFFDDKPSEAIRTLLKSKGFKWSGKNMAWQRQLTNNAIDAAREIIKEMEIIE